MTAQYIEWQLGINSSNAVRLYPDHKGYRDKRTKLFSDVRAEAGPQYRYTFGHYDKFEFNCNYMPETTALWINSWWEADSELLLFKITEVDTIIENTAPTSCCTDPVNDENVTSGWGISESSLYVHSDANLGHYLEVYAPTSIQAFGTWGSRTVMAGRRYYFSADIACDSNTQYKLELRDSAGSYYWFGNSRFNDGQGSDSWETHSIEFEARTTDANLHLYFSITDSGYSGYINNVIFGLVHQTEIDSVMIQGKEKPFGEFTPPYVDKYSGKIALETY